MKSAKEKVLEPVRIDEYTWYYPYPAFMLLVHECRNPDGTLVKTDEIKIRWRTIEKSLDLLAQVSRKRKAA